MYFTRFPINMTRREARRMLASPYRLHAAVVGSFPFNGYAEREGRILWRIDEHPNGGAYLYIVSPMQPSLIGLNEQIGFPDLEPLWKTRDYEPFLKQISVGQRYAFRLVANPTVSRSTRGENTRVANTHGSSKRIPHLTIMQQGAWLIGKEAYNGTGVEVPKLFSRETTTRASRNGFRVLKNQDDTPCLIISHSHKQTFIKNPGTRITLMSAQYDGVLEVTNSEALCHALTNGIGHGKGFGCGLLTLAVSRKE